MQLNTSDDDIEPSILIRLTEGP